MASVTPAAGEMGFAPGLSGSATQQHSASCNPPVRAGQACVERVASVRIIRRHPHWRGVALRLAGGEDGAERFELALTAGDGRSITVAVVDQDNGVAVWRDCGRTSGLPLLFETADGVVSEPYPQLGRLALGPIRLRRRHALLNGRRPRFLARRKTGRLADRPVILAGERLTD